MKTLIRISLALLVGGLVFGAVWIAFRMEAIWTQRTALWWWFATWTPRAAGVLASVIAFFNIR